MSRKEVVEFEQALTLSGSHIEEQKWRLNDEHGSNYIGNLRENDRRRKGESWCVFCKVFETTGGSGEDCKYISCRKCKAVHYCCEKHQAAEIKKESTTRVGLGPWALGPETSCFTKVYRSEIILKMRTARSRRHSIRKRTIAGSAQIIEMLRPEMLI